MALNIFSRINFIRILYFQIPLLNTHNNLLYYCASYDSYQRWLNPKIPRDFRSRGWGSGIWDPQKSSLKNSRKIPNPRDGDFLKSGDFHPGDWGFLSPGNEDFSNLGIFIPGMQIFIPWIGDFWKSGDYWRFFGDWDFSEMVIYFRGMGISHPKATSDSYYPK